MLLSLPAFRSSRRVVASLLAVLCAVMVLGSPIAAHAQNTLIAPPQTKEEVAAQEKAAAAAAADNTGGSVPLEAWLAIAGVLIIGGATFYMLRDSRAAVAEDPRRSVVRPASAGGVRGAPKTMFEGEAAPGGKVGRNKKREKSKRQKQARRHNRPGK